MLNVDKVFTAKWVPLDKVRDYVDDVVANLPTGVQALTTEQKNAIHSALDTSRTGVIEPTAPFADFQENNGIVIPDTPSCLEIAKDYYKAALGEDIDTTAETHVGRMIEQSAIILKSAIGMCAANVMQTDLNCATGRYLDALGFLFFSNRKAAVATKVGAVLSNATAGAISITAGSCEVKDAAGNVFYLGSDVTVPAASGGVSGTVQCTLVCTETGTVVPDESVLTWTAPSGVTTPTSFASVTLGYDVESDTAFRARLKDTRVSSVGFLQSVKSALLSLDGVYDAHVIENTSNEQATIQGVSLSPHSILSYVDYDGTDETGDAVAEQLFSHKAVGCGYTTGLSAEYGTQVQKTVVDSSFNTPYTVTFYKPAQVRVYVAITVTRNEYSGKDLEGDVKKAITSWANGDVPYVDGIKIGQKVKAYEIGAAVSYRIPEIQIDSVGLGTASASRTSTIIDVNAYQIATIGIGDINVTIA